MSSPSQKQPDEVADKVLRRVEVSKIARKLQGRLALATFKAKNGWEDLALDSIEPKLEEQKRQRRQQQYEDVQSDSSSSTSELPYPTTAKGSGGLMSSPLKAPLFSDSVEPGSSGGGSTGHRKRNYMSTFDMDIAMSSPTKRFRPSPPSAHRSSFPAPKEAARHQYIKSSPIRPRRQQHFTTSDGPHVSFFPGVRRGSVPPSSPEFAVAPPSDDDDDDDLLPVHSFNLGRRSNNNNSRESPPRTPPPMRNRSRNIQKEKSLTAAAANGPKTGEEGADLLLYLAASPSPAVHSTLRRMDSRMEPPSTPPPQREPALPSSMMNTPGGVGGSGGGMFPQTPGQPFDFSDFVNITPSPAQKPWKTPVPQSSGKTPRSVARRRLTFDEPPPGLT